MLSIFRILLKVRKKHIKSIYILDKNHLHLLQTNP